MRLVVTTLTLLLAAGCSDAGLGNPSAPFVDFVASVEGERFVLRLSDPAAIRLARAARAGRASVFPLGPLNHGNGGFNAPWSWHLDPERTQLVEAAIEVCDGRPSHVEAHLSDFPTYCPWGARIVDER